MDKLLKMTEEGSHTVFSQQFDASYHSSHGAIQETRTVFIEAGFLNLSAQEYHNINILEIGFGTGLNAFMTYLETIKRPTQVYYHSVEAFPISIALAEQLNYVNLLDAKAHQDAFLKMHQFPNEKIRLEINKAQSFDFFLQVEMFENIDFFEHFDLIYFDAFAPSTQAHFWEAPFLEKMYKALSPGGMLVTYCAQGAFKRALKSVGFQIEGLPGPKGKREMTRAKKILVL